MTKKKLILFFVILVGVYLLSNSYLPESNMPKIKVGNNTVAPNAWNGVVPGKTKLNDVGYSFGRKINTFSYNDTLTKLVYETPNIATFPLEVLVDKNDTIILISTANTDYSATRESIIKKFKLPQNPAAELYLNVGGPMSSLYVYPQEGLAIYGKGIINGPVYRIIYFTPMTLKDFMELVQDEYSTSPNKEFTF